jgi:hypothetical protein
MLMTAQAVDEHDLADRPAVAARVTNITVARDTACDTCKLARTTHGKRE